ncbi:hypothetical protein CIFRMA203M1_23130 [Citrobacter freundii]
MKDYKPRYKELYKYYQVWLTDFTKLTVRSGMCHQNIYHHHTLTVGSLKFPGEEEVIAIVPPVPAPDYLWQSSSIAGGQ